MQYEDIVYNAGILAMAARLEAFLEEWEQGEEGQKEVAKAKNLGDYRDDKYSRLDRFMKARQKGAKKGMRQGMKKLFRNRDTVAHKRANIGGPGFDEIRCECIKVDKWLAAMKPPPAARLPCMGEVMISCSLRYDMGNAGDIIKHGILAEFARWWIEEGQKLRYADPFGGRPWGGSKPAVKNRLSRFKNSNCALWKAQKESQSVASGGLYYGSSHVVLNTAQERVDVFADDADKIARADLKASGLHIISDELPDYRGNGYSILQPAILKAGQYNLILIDPHADFLRTELSHPKEKGQFSKIKDAIEDPANCDLWVAIFVLMDNDHREEYESRRKHFFCGHGIALRCPCMPVQEDQPDGEHHYDMEILLVSSRLAVDSSCPRIAALRKKITEFKATAEKAFGVKKIKAWGLE